MANGLVIVSERASTEVRAAPGPTRSRRHLASFFDGLLLLAGCAAFVVSTSIATNGGTSIDDFRFWLIGLAPIGLLFGLSGALAHKDIAGNNDWLSRRFIAIWIVTLGVFCLSRDFQFYKDVHHYVESIFPFGKSLTEFGTGAVLSTVATAGESAEVASPKTTFEPMSLDEIERRHIHATLRATGWNKSRTAAILGVERSTLDRKIRRYDLKPPNIRADEWAE